MDGKNELLEQIRATDFALIELNLFLDTHPSDENALKDFRMLAETREKLYKQFTQKYGPLQAADGATSDCWLWINDPWPWDQMKWEELKGGMANVGLRQENRVSDQY